MPRYVSFDPQAQINGESIVSVLEAMPTVRNMVLQILEKNGIQNPLAGHWYPYQSWLQTFEDIEDRFGSNTLYFIGLQVIHNSIFPDNIQDIYQGIESLHIAYHTNVRGRNMGYYKIQERHSNLIRLECYNPNPCPFDRGIITGVARKFKPADATLLSVETDNRTRNKADGEATSTYIISW